MLVAFTLMSKQQKSFQLARNYSAFIDLKCHCNDSLSEHSLVLTALVKATSELIYRVLHYRSSPDEFALNGLPFACVLASRRLEALQEAFCQVDVLYCFLFEFKCLLLYYYCAILSYHLTGWMGSGENGEVKAEKQLNIFLSSCHELH